MSFQFGSGPTTFFGNSASRLPAQPPVAANTASFPNAGPVDPNRFGSSLVDTLGSGSSSTVAAFGGVGPPAPSSETAWLPEALQQSYRILDANAPEYPFVFFSFNRREDASSEQPSTQALPQLPPCPRGPLDRLWAEAVHSNPDPKRYTVVRIAGFQALQERVALQHQRLQEIIRATEAMEQRVSRLRVVFEQSIGSKLGWIRAQQSQLETQFLSTVALLECALTVRAAAAVSGSANLHSISLKRDNTAELRLRTRLEALRKELDGANGMRQRALIAYDTVTEISESLGADGAGRLGGGYASETKTRPFPAAERVRPADPVSAQNLQEILDYERQGMEHIREVLERDRREIESIRHAARDLLGPLQ